jgi:hypothetical protein
VEKRKWKDDKDKRGETVRRWKEEKRRMDSKEEKMVG